MEISKKHLSILLKRYPDAPRIVKEICEFDLESIDTNNNLDLSLQGSMEVASELEIYLSEISPFSSIVGDIYTTLRDGLIFIYKRKINNILLKHKGYIENLSDIAMSLATQSVRHISDDVRQLCFFISKLKDKKLLNLNSWCDVFNEFTTLKSKIEINDIHINKLLSEFTCRIGDDRLIIQKEFNIDSFLIKKIEISLGDFHDVGKGIIRVFFNNRSLVYKTRGAENEILIKRIRDDLLKNEKNIQIGIPSFIHCGDYSWHEYIVFSNPKNESIAIKYYKNIGASLAFFHILNGSDLHFENIICVEDIPYFIDLECVFSGYVNEDILSGTVLNTLIIPSLSGSLTDRLICGMGEKELDDECIKRRWLDMDEEMNVKIIEKSVKISGIFNRPSHDKFKISKDYLCDAIFQGFDSIIEIIKEKPSIYNTIKIESQIRSRIILRPTRFYYDILFTSNHPVYASNPILRDCFIACALYSDKFNNSIMKYEYSTIREGRIPIFHMNVFNGCCYNSSGEQFVIDDKISSLKDLKNKIYRTINLEEESFFQRELIHKSLYVLFPSIDKPQKVINDIDAITEFMSESSINYKGRDVFLNLKKDIHGARGISLMKGDLYSGMGGATFLQICNFISNPNLYNENKLIRLYETTRKISLTRGIGCFEESGSLLYIEYLFFKYIKNDNNQSEFNRVLNVILNIIKKQDDKPVDIINGMAGILIVCCRMYELSRSKLCIIAIKYLTRTIIEKSVLVGSECVTWSNGWAGFSHGNSGIAYSLLLANNVLRNPVVDNLIICALRYEVSLKIDTGWRKGVDAYEIGKDSNSWCHGAPGIYLSRKAMLDEMLYEQNEIKEIAINDIEYYIETRNRREKNNHNSLCHGCYGNAIIDPDQYGRFFDPTIYDVMEDKSLMHGYTGAVYVNLFYSNAEGKIPNLLILK